MREQRGYMRRIEVRHLRLVKAIAETKNLTKAARMLFISQPALSRQLQEIEQQLGTQLFVRTKKSMILTKPGEKLLRTAVLVLPELDQTEREIAQNGCGEPGVVKVGTSCPFSYQWVPSVISQFQSMYPNIDIEIGNSVRVRKELFSKKFDLVITGYLASRENIDVTPLFEDEMVVIMSADHPWRAKKYVIDEDFRGARLISIFEKSQDVLYQYLMSVGIKPERFTKLDQPDAVIELVKGGLGISIVPGWVVDRHLKSGALKACSLTKGGTRLEWVVAYLNQTQLPHFQEDLLKLIVERAAELRH
jgi:LysR family transcriptional regulator, regulator for metE and metH